MYIEYDTFGMSMVYDLVIVVLHDITYLNN